MNMFGIEEVLTLMHPNGSDFLTNGYHIEERYGYKEQDAYHEHQPATTGIQGREHLFHHIQIECTDIEHDTYREHQHHGIESDSKHLIRQGHSVRPITDEQQIFQLGGVLLQQEVDAEHEDIER